MSKYLNPGKSSFEDVVRSEVFVDKSELLLYLNSVVGTNQRYVSVSRPRRFGKSIAAKMICAYYSKGAESRKLFEQLNVSSSDSLERFLRKSDRVENSKDYVWDMYNEEFDVISITMTEFLKSNKSIDEGLTKMQQLIARDIRKAYPKADYFDEDLIQVFDDAYEYSKRRFVIVIDEWDAVFRERQEDKDGQKRYLDFLRDWMKDKDYIALAYMTGILPIKKYGKHSALNMFTEYSMMLPRQMAQYTGFTETEVRGLCQEYNMRYEDVSDWYDGYVVSDRVPLAKREAYRQGQYDGYKYSIYNPLSVVEAMITGKIQNYWNKTESYEALAEYIRMNYDGLKDSVALLMDGGRLAIDTSTYQNDMTTFTCRDDVLSLLIHVGYLGYDDEAGEVFIPNKEILDEFKASTKSSEWDETFQLFENSKKLL